MQLASTLALTLAALTTAAPPTTRHFYTTDPNGEYAPSLGYKFKIPAGVGINGDVPGTVPLYRCRNAGADSTFLTTSSACEGAAGFVLEGVMTNIYTSPQPGTVEYRRLVNVIGDHVYWTYNQDNRQGPIDYFACDVGQYALEGVVGYVYNRNSIPDGMSGRVKEIWGFRKGCNSDGDPCCNQQG